MSDLRDLDMPPSSYDYCLPYSSQLDVPNDLDDTPTARPRKQAPLDLTDLAFITFAIVVVVAWFAPFAPYIWSAR